MQLFAGGIHMMSDLFKVLALLLILSLGLPAAMWTFDEIYKAWVVTDE